MKYVGEKFSQQAMNSTFQINPKNVYITYVNGKGINPCGHALLRVRATIRKMNGIYYFHIPGIDSRRKKFGFYDEPYYFHEVNFPRYMQENNKDYSTVKHIQISGISQSGAQKMSEKLKKLMSEPYAWMGDIHNCLSFVEEILAAGNSSYRDRTLYDCPTIDLKQNPSWYLRAIFPW